MMPNYEEIHAYTVRKRKARVWGPRLALLGLICHIAAIVLAALRWATGGDVWMIAVALALFGVGAVCSGWGRAMTKYAQRW